MAETANEVHVRLAADGFYPQGFMWAGRFVRVLSVAGLRTCGVERRFQLRTVEGVYHLTLDTRTQIWRMRRSPTWFSRALAQMAQEPRYTLASWRRRARRSLRSQHRAKNASFADGGEYASGFALVR